VSEEKAVPVAVPTAVPVGSTNTRPDQRETGVYKRTRATTTTSSPGSPSLRTGRRGLAAVQQSLSARDLTVLRLVDEHRYLTTPQIEGWCFADHATPLTGARVARRVLRRLHDLRVLAHLQRRIGGVHPGSASFVWRVGPVGDRLLRENVDRPRRRQREPGSPFLDHTLAVAEAHLALVRAHRAGHIGLIEVQLEPDCWRQFTGVGGSRLVLQPDLYVVTEDPTDPAYVNTWFVEIDRGTENPARLLAKSLHYSSYAATGTEQHDGNSFPLVVGVVPTENDAARLLAALRSHRQIDAALFRVTTPAAFVDLIAGGAV
jgi:hypothetical protein